MSSSKKILALAISLFSINTVYAAKHVVIEYAVYKNTTCSGKLVGKDKIDTGKKCFNYSYVDSKGVTTRGSLGNFHCYKDKVVMNKYPFAQNCTVEHAKTAMEKITNMDSPVPAAPGCRIAPSHEGQVSERLENYTYPGNENCEISDDHK
jgi:hypothetical protein